MHTVGVAGLNRSPLHTVQKDESPMAGTNGLSLGFSPVRTREHDVRPEKHRITVVQGFNPHLGRAFSKEVSHDYRFRKALP